MLAFVAVLAAPTMDRRLNTADELENGPIAVVLHTFGLTWSNYTQPQEFSYMSAGQQAAALFWSLWKT